jgi:hypothetical protein
LDGKTKKPWDTHDFKVKMLDWTAARGSRLAYTCRHCGRKFCHFTILNQGAWAVDGDGRALENSVSDRWLAEQCPRLLNVRDEDDRKRLSRPAAGQ